MQPEAEEAEPGTKKPEAVAEATEKEETLQDFQLSSRLVADADLPRFAVRFVDKLSAAAQEVTKPQAAGENETDDATKPQGEAKETKATEVRTFIRRQRAVQQIPRASNEHSSYMIS